MAKKGKIPPQFAANIAKMKAKSGGDHAKHQQIAKHAAAAAKHMDSIKKLTAKDCP